MPEYISQTLLSTDYLNKRPDNDKDTVFSNELFDSLYPDGIEHHYWTKARNKIIFSVLKKLGADTKKIIEVGCGRGVVTKFLHENHVPIEGFELAKLPPYPGTEGFVHMGTDARFLPQEKKDRFEVMLLLDVVEHVESPQEFLADLLANFKNVKTLIITVPACQEIWSNFDVFNGHYRRYDMKMANELIRSVNLRTVYSAYAYHSLYAIMRLLLFLNRKERSTRIKAPTKKNLSIHSIMCQLLMLDYGLISNKRKGSSLIIAGTIA